MRSPKWMLGASGVPSDSSGRDEVRPASNLQCRIRAVHYAGGQPHGSRPELNFNSGQALDHYLKPLREADLLRQRIEEDGTIVFEWSNLFRRLPRTAIKAILGAGK